MPNQRAKNKLYLGGFVEKELHAKIMRLAEESGMGDNRFGFVTQLVQEAIQNRKRNGKAKAAATHARAARK